MRAPSVGLFTEVYHPVRNGVVASVDALARALARQGCEITCVTPHMPRYLDAPGECFVARLPSLPLPTRTAYRLTLPYLENELRRRSRRFSIIHAHSPFVTGALAAGLARRARVPLVFTYHTQLEAYAHYVPFEARAVRAAAREITRRFANLADAVIAPTRAMRTYLRELGVRAPIAVVPSGIDAAFYASGSRELFRARYGIARDARVVLYAGRLGREKNVETVIVAFGRLADPRARLVLAGDGPHRARLEREARACGVAGRVVFTGELPREALPAAYAGADAFAFASRSETQGLVLVEALAAGLPVVAVDTPQTREVLGDGGDVVADDPAALAAALDRVLGAEPGSAARGELRARAVRTAQRFGEDAHGERVFELYRRLLGETDASRRLGGAALARVN